MSDDREAAPVRPRGVGRLAVSWLLGCAAAISQVGFATGRAATASAALGATAAVIIWLLGLRRWRDDAVQYVASLAVLGVAGAAAWRSGYAYPFSVVVIGTVVAHGALIRWSPVPSLPQRRTPIAGLALGPLVAAMVSWARDPNPARFALLSFLAVVLLEGYSRLPATAERVDRAIERGAHSVSHAITFGLASLVMVVVIVPVHAVSRLFGYSPLDGGWAGPSTAWVRVDPLRHRTPDRQPARPDSMTMLDLPPTNRVRRRGRLRMSVPLLVLAALLVTIGPSPWDAGSGDATTGADTTADATSTFTRRFEDDPAFDDAPWAKDLRLDLLDAWQNLEFNGAVGGWGIRDVASRYINVTDGERATTPPDPALGKPVDIWLLGGSAAFGAGQRDEHTIASELVERAGADGVALRVHNLAVPATVNWQEAMLLIARLKWAEPPDLVLVYDGANDLALQGVLESQGKGGSDEPASLVDGQLDQILRERAKAKDPDLPALKPVAADEKRSPEESGALVATRYRRGVELIQAMCDEAGVPVSIFWQPDLLSKHPLSKADRHTLDQIDVEDGYLATWRRFSGAARADLGDLGVVDLTRSLDGVDAPIYWDSVHTNEDGAALVAASIYDRLEPTLRELRQAR